MNDDLEPIIYNISKQLEHLVKAGKKLVYVGRFCPMHLGHQAMIGGMIKAAPDNHLVLIGSCNQPLSYRNLFSFTDRVSFIQTVFPNVKFAALPDFKEDNTSWFLALNALITLSGKCHEDAVFIGGCEEDIQFFIESGRETFIINRFSGITEKISGTEIRDHLITGNIEDLKKYLDERIIDEILYEFKKQWDKLKRL